MLNAIEFVGLFLILLCLPGLALQLLLREKQSYLFLHVVAFSYGFFALGFLCVRLFDLGWFIWQGIVIVSLLISALIVFINKRKLFEFDLISVPVFGIVLGVSVYHYVVGAYTEIPADFYYHVELMRHAYEAIKELKISVISFSDYIKADAQVWYYFLAFLVHVTGVEFVQAVGLTMWLSKVFFLVATYQFCVFLFAEKVNKALIALLSTLLVAIQMGVTVFAYIRYYSFAPAMLAWVLYFAAMVVVLEFLQTRSLRWVSSKLLYFVFLLLATFAIHTQEALFIVCMASIAWLMALARIKWRELNGLILLVGLLIVFGFMAAYLFIHTSLSHFGNFGNRLWDFAPANGLLPQLSILNLSYQFMQVVSLFGVFVYALFFLHIKRYKQNDYLMAGMLSPLFLVVNPFFTDVFLRLTDSTVLWRFCFLIPIYYVAADLIIYYSRLVFDRQKNALLRSGGVASLLVMGGLLLPYYNTWQGLHFSRYPTLKSVPAQRSYEHLSDVIAFLNTVEGKKELITDPVTGYVLSGFTKHYNQRDKFFCLPYSNCKPFVFDDYSNQPLAQYKGALLVVNKRVSGVSFVGALSRHWPEKLLQQVTNYYPPLLLSHLEKSARLLFSNNNVSVYEIY